ncbi:Pol polyprotein [Elysia marginata]|uniref:Pol polyprotein n=1 Tax=Elysia marginata TaxID=1093978 RepID=A0AAV4H7U7_9GAST|nr:Pol polyprotein [Elysia marginata]
MGLSCTCQSCVEHQNNPPKAPVHPWMLPEKHWSRLQIDHAVNCMDKNWLMLIDAYSTYPTIHATSPTSNRATIHILEEDFAHFGFCHTIVSDNATPFTSNELQSWCRERGISHSAREPYHPATNGAAERLVQSFKNSLWKSSLLPFQEFLMINRRTFLSSGLSPREILNGRQIRSLIDMQRPFLVHIAQGRQSKAKKKHV